MKKFVDLAAKPNRHLLPILLFASMAIGLYSGNALAEIYRVVDKDGNISFSDKPGSGDQGESSSRVEHNDEDNRSESPQAIEDKQQPWVKEAKEKREAEREKQREIKRAEREIKMENWKAEMQAARAALADAEKALERGLDPTEGDYIGMANGGSRPSIQYLEKLETLEKNVENAKKHLKKVKRQKP